MANKTISDLATDYHEHISPVGLVIDDDTILSQALAAARYYQGYGQLIHLADNAPIAPDTLLDESEVAVVAPLFRLYVERENALILESTRTVGVEVYGRSVAEIANDITQKEQEIQNLAFSFQIFTV